MGILSLLIFIPLIAAIAILCLPAQQKDLFKKIALGASVLQLLMAFQALLKFDPSNPKIQLAEKLNWISARLGSWGILDIDYFIAIDGLSISMVILSAFVFVVAAVCSWKIEENEKAYFSLFLLLSSTVMGCFLALDFFLFFLFFEFMLLPMYFLIGIWGGPRREYAAIKFFLYTLLGSMLILMVMVGLYASVIDPVSTSEALGLGCVDKNICIATTQNLLEQKLIAPERIVHTFNMLYMADIKNYIPGSILSSSNAIILCGMTPRMIAFIALLIGFLIKLPAFPFHTWLPDAHVEASTAISVILAAILLKVGGYGLLRVAYTIFPDAALHLAFWIGLGGLISIIYGALNALAMTDLKKMIAYSSISHMGFVLLGIAALTPEGLNGAMFTMFSHGIISAALFILVGVLYDRTHDRMIDSYRGIAFKMPLYTTVTVIAFFASLGLPGFSGFIGEILVLLGAFQSKSVNDLLPRWMAATATIGILIGAGYYLWALQRMFFGKYWVKGGKAWNTVMTDLNRREMTMILPLIALMIIFGLFPNIILHLFDDYFAVYIENIIDKGHFILKSH